MAFERFKGFLSLGNDTNKVDGESLQEGVISKLTPELELDTKDEEFIALKKQWIQTWLPVQEKLSKMQKEAENYWKGEHPNDFLRNTADLEQKHPMVDNIIFEALETFLPEATRKNSEPVVFAPENSEEDKTGAELADNVRKTLIYLSDHLTMRLKLKSVTRNWALYFLGVAKVGWDNKEDEISLTSLRPQKFIFDPAATVDEKGKYTGEYLGEYKEESASNLAKRFPDKKDEISQMVNSKMGTKIQYIEWWADYGKIVFWTLKDVVLAKARNPHWNYDEEVEIIEVDEFGEEEVKIDSITGANHFNQPQFPYVFLTMFNLGVQPFDVTSLVFQNLGNQDVITKRQRQIDENVDGMNGGWAISGEKSGIQKEQAYGAIEAFRDGRGVWIPQGSVGEAVQRMQGNGLPTDVFNNLADTRQELRSIFGVAGSTPQGIASEDTVRGKIIVGQKDQSRTGGGITEYLEQFADRTYNLMVQMMYVYYDQPHLAAVIGKNNAMETVSIRNTDLDRKITVSVKEGSMIPKDPLTQANQAIDLATAGFISPLTLHERLDDPNPQQTVKELLEFQQGAITGVPVAPAGTEQVEGGNLLDSVPIQ